MADTHLASVGAGSLRSLLHSKYRATDPLAELPHSMSHRGRPR